MVIKDINEKGYIFQSPNGRGVVPKPLDFVLPEGTAWTSFSPATGELTCFFDPDENGEPVDPVIIEITVAQIEAAALQEDMVELKALKRSALLAEYRALHAQGYDTGLGWAMPFGSSDRSAYNEVLQLTKTRLDRAEIVGTDIVLLADVIGLPHSDVQAGDLEDLMVGYGVAYQTLWNRLPVALAAVIAAGTKAELDAIVL